MVGWKTRIRVGAMAYLLDLDWVRQAGKSDDEEEDGMVKNVLQVSCGVLY